MIKSALADLGVAAAPHAAAADAPRGGACRCLRRRRLARRAGVRRLEHPRHLDGIAGRRCRPVRAGFRRGHRPAAPPRRGLPPRLERVVARRLAGTAPRPCPSTSAAAAIRGSRSSKSARDPAGRGPTVRLDRRRDRPPEGGPGCRLGARPNPVRSSFPATAWCGPTGTSASTRWVDRTSSAESCRPKAWTSIDSRTSRARASATSGPTRRASSACRRAPRTAGDGEARDALRVCGDADRAGYRPCKMCRPVKAAA